MTTNDELTERLRAAGRDYPRPDQSATQRTRAAFVTRAGLDPAHEHTGGRRRRALRPRLVVAAVAVAILVASAFGAGLAIGSSGDATPPSPTLDGPGFLPASGWNVLQSGLTIPPEGPSAIAATAPLDPDDVRIGGRPSDTLAALEQNDVLIYAMFIPSGQIPAVDRQFPERDLPLRLRDAEPGGLEGLQAAGKVLRFGARTGGYNIDILVVFGAREPSPAVERAADEELGRLVVPGCPSDAPRVAPHEREHAQRYVLEWLSAHYPGPRAHVEAARARAAVVGVDPAPRGDAVLAECGDRVRERAVEVDVVLPEEARRNTGRFPLTYFVLKTENGWTLWRQG